MWCRKKKKISQILSGTAVFGLCRFLPDGSRYQGPIRERRHSSPSLPVTLIPVEHNSISYQHCFVSRPSPPPPTHQTLLVFSSLLIIKTFSNPPPVSLQILFPLIVEFVLVCFFFPHLFHSTITLAQCFFSSPTKNREKHLNPAQFVQTPAEPGDDHTLMPAFIFPAFYSRGILPKKKEKKNAIRNKQILTKLQGHRGENS